MLYRLYTPEDFAALYAIEETCFQPPVRFPRRFMQRLVEAANTATWIAEEEDQMAGFAILEWTEEPDGVFAYIQTIEVIAEERGRGVGSELLRRVEDSARDAGAAVLWLHVDAKNSGAIRLYEAHGFKSTGRAEDYYARGKAALIYRKWLEQSG